MGEVAKIQFASLMPDRGTSESSRHNDGGITGPDQVVVNPQHTAIGLAPFVDAVRITQSIQRVRGHAGLNIREGNNIPGE